MCLTRGTLTWAQHGVVSMKLTHTACKPTLQAKPRCRPTCRAYGGEVTCFRVLWLLTSYIEIQAHCELFHHGPTFFFYSGL